MKKIIGASELFWSKFLVQKQILSPKLIWIESYHQKVSVHFKWLSSVHVLYSTVLCVLMWYSSICVVNLGHKGWVQTLEWSPNGAVLASGSMDGCIWLWNPHSGKSIRRPLKAHAYDSSPSCCLEAERVNTVVASLWICEIWICEMNDSLSGDCFLV
jgi:WD40 repeat protein